MTWWAIDVRSEPARREWVGAWLVARTGQAVEEREDGTLVTFAEDERAADDLAAALAAAVAHEQGGVLETARRPLEAIDWTLRWRDGLGARRFGRLTVAPSWVAPPESDDGPRVVLDPENAFGSGEHGSTRAALTLLEKHLRPGDRVLDLGSGSGILAIAAVKLGAVRAIGIENDAEAKAVAARNAVRNGVADAVEFIDGDAGDLTPLLGPADLVVSNILRTVNTALLPAIVSALRPGGLAILSGMEELESATFRPVLAAAGLAECDEAIDAAWWAVAAARG
ncbi:MAG: 50S ribosomal protein L11 methyltransferase [Gemmatimonadales bacterium]